MNEVLQKMAVAQMEFWSAVEKVSSKDAPITEEQYQAERHKRILAHLREHITDKRVSLDVVAEWSGKKVDYCREKVIHRGGNNNLESRWAVDVVVFLCDLWAIAVPSWCKEVRDKFGIQ